MTGFRSTAQWQRIRVAILRRDSFTCQICGAMLRGGRSDKSRTVLRPAVVDHIIPHKGDEALFFDPENLWAVDCDCHDSICQSIESRLVGRPDEIRKAKLEYRIIGIDGYPKAPPDRWVDRGSHKGGKKVD